MKEDATRSAAARPIGKEHPALFLDLQRLFEQGVGLFMLQHPHEVSDRLSGAFLCLSPAIQSAFLVALARPR